jgi:glycosyltransferase involved in cell wall biosynthesis
MAYGGAERGVSDLLPIHNQNGFDIDLLLLDGIDHIFKLNLNGIKIFNLGVKINIYNPFLVFKIIPFLRNYDVVHVSLFPSFYWVGLASIFIKNKPKLIFTEHNTTNKRRNSFLFRKIDKFIYKRFDHVVNISKGSHNSFLEYTNHKIASSIIYNGVNFNTLMNVSKIENMINEFVYTRKVILQVSSFRDDKDHETLLRALNLLPEDYVLLLAGEGKNLNRCKNICKKLNIDDRVLFLGNVNNIGDLIRLSNICVLSSHVEGFGRSAVESMFLGKPTIGTNVEGLSEVIGNEKLLFGVGNYKMLSELILDLNNINLYKQISEECHDQAKKYSHLNMISSYEDLYLKLFNNSII